MGPFLWIVNECDSLALDPRIQVLRRNVVRFVRIIQHIFSEAHRCVLSRLSLFPRENLTRHGGNYATKMALITRREFRREFSGIGASYVASSPLSQFVSRVALFEVRHVCPSVNNSWIGRVEERRGCGSF